MEKEQVSPISVKTQAKSDLDTCSASNTSFDKSDNQSQESDQTPIEAQKQLETTDIDKTSVTKINGIKKEQESAEEMIFNTCL